jgi:hypothetical protein
MKNLRIALCFVAHKSNVWKYPNSSRKDLSAILAQALRLSSKTFGQPTLRTTAASNHCPQAQQPLASQSLSAATVVLTSYRRAKEIEMTSGMVLRSVASFVGQLRKKGLRPLFSRLAESNSQNPSGFPRPSGSFSAPPVVRSFLPLFGRGLWRRCFFGGRPLNCVALRSAPGH